MKSLMRTLLVLALVAGLGTGAWFIYQRMTGPAAAATSDSMTQVVAVQRGDLAATLSVVGELYAVQSEQLTFSRLKGNTLLASLEVAAGSQVVAGQVLATIDASAYQQALDQAKSDLADAEQKLVDLGAPATALQLAQADLKVAQAELALRLAQDNQDTLENPEITSFLSAVADARVKLSQAQADLVALDADPEGAANKLWKLQETEANKWDTYQRLAAEKYSDVYYQDRLLVAANAFNDAQEARIRSEIQTQVDKLKAQSSVRKSQRTLATAEEALAEAQAGIDELELATARHSVSQAEADLLSAQEDRAALEVGATTTALAVAQADADKKRTAVADAAADLAGATLVAPFAGAILQTHVATGARINSGSAIVTVADMTQLEVLASVDETTIRQISPGQGAILSFDAFPNQTFTGEVLDVPLQGSLQGGIMVYDVPISLVGAENLALKVGMTSNVTVQVGEVKNALLVPALALQQVGGMYQVLVAGGGGDADAEPVSAPVEVGLSNGVYTQITRGLNEGDQVVMQLSSSSSAGFDPGAMRALMGGAGGAPGGALPGAPSGAASGGTQRQRSN